MSKTIHQGKNVKRLRELMGIKQEALADMLGLEWTQQRISTLEDKEVIDQAILAQVAEVLKVPAEAIRSFTEEAVINVINQTITNTNHDQGVQLGVNSGTYNFNPIDKWIETLADYKKAIEDNKKLYEALLKEKDEKLALLERFLNEKKK